jgi:hypothetical protein
MHPYGNKHNPAPKLFAQLHTSSSKAFRKNL